MKKKDIKSFMTIKSESLLNSEIRLFIMTILAMYNEVDFKFLKNELKATDGNLGSNMLKLEKDKYITSKKMFVGRIPKTLYKISPFGESQLKEYLNKMEAIKKIIGL